MDTKSYEQLLFIKATIESNKQEAYKSHKETNEKLTLFTDNLQVLIALITEKNNISKSSSAQKDTQTPPDSNTVVPNKNRGPPLEGGHSTKIRGMWTLKHEIISPKLYELLIKIELKGETDLDLKNFLNHIKMSLNAVTRLREDILPDYQSIKRHSNFEE